MHLDVVLCTLVVRCRLPLYCLFIKSPYCFVVLLAVFSLILSGFNGCGREVVREMSCMRKAGLYEQVNCD